jgi:hypothetical protein
LSIGRRPSAITGRPVTNSRKPIAGDTSLSWRHERGRLLPDCRRPPQAYIRELETRNRQLGERITQLEEQFRLAQSRRFAPSSEKLKDRVFDEAEQIAGTEPDDMDAGATDEAFVLPDTGLPDPPAPTGSKPGRRPLPAHLPRRRIEYDLPESAKVCPCCAHALHRMGEEISEQLHIE